MTDSKFVPIPLNTADGDAWDDSALIAAFDSAVASHRLASENDGDQEGDSDSQGHPIEEAPPPTPVAPVRKRQRAHSISNGASKKKSTEERKNTSHAVHTAPGALPSLTISIPPPPPFELQGDAQLHALLASWYEAGYRAGTYAASKRQRHDNKH